MTSRNFITTFVTILAVSIICSSAHGAFLFNQQNTYTVNTLLTGDDFGFNGNSTWTWKANQGAVVNFGNGGGTSNSGRFFVGLNGNATSGDGTWVLTSDAGTPGSYVFNGGNIAGRLGHITSNRKGTLEIDGGVSVSMTDTLSYSGNGVTNELNVLDGLLDLTDPGFGYSREGSAFLGHTVGEDGAITIDALVSDAAGFTTWAGNSAITIASYTTFDLVFTQNISAGTTTITAPAPPPDPVPEPTTILIAALGLLGMGWLGWRRRKRA